MDVNTVSYTGAIGVGQNTPTDKSSASNFVKKTLENTGIDIGDKDVATISGKDITNAHFLNAMNISIKDNISSQVGLEFNASGVTSLVSRDFLSSIGYEGKNLNDLSQEEAKKMLGEDGIFGIKQTSQRIADFIINGAGDDLEKLQDGRAGMMKGFAEATKLISGSFGRFELPDITKETMLKAQELVDARIKELGGNVLDIQA